MTRKPHRPHRNQRRAGNRRRAVHAAKATVGATVAGTTPQNVTGDPTNGKRHVEVRAFARRLAAAAATVAVTVVAGVLVDLIHDHSHPRSVTREHNEGPRCLTAVPAHPDPGRPSPTTTGVDVLLCW